jgi:cobalt-precorrin 5A hydrolase
VAQISGFSPFSVRELATVDLKKSEQGLEAAADALGVPMRFFSAAALRDREARLEPGTVRESLFVKKRIGVGNVCELAALAAGGEKLVVPKTVFPGVTVAVAAAPWP